MIYRTTIEKIKEYNEFDFPKDYSHLNNIPDFLEYIRSYNNMTAFIFPESKSKSYSDFYKDIEKVSTKMRAGGINKGDNVGIFCVKKYYTTVSSLAAMAFGAVAVMLPGIDEVCLDRCDIVKVFTDEEICSYLTESEVTGQLEPVQLLPDAPACIFFTSGTTGDRRASLLSHRNLIAGAYNGLFYRVKEVECSMVALPLIHVFGYIRSLLRNILAGVTVCFNDTPEDIFHDFALYRPDETVLIPRQLEIVLAMMNRYGYDATGGALKCIITGAAGIPTYLYEEYMNYGIMVYPGYGLTESTNLTTGNPIPIKKPSSVGLTFNNIELSIDMSENYDGSGEILLRGDTVFLGYYKKGGRLDRTAFTEDGFFRTGDLGKLDKDGFLYITGRIKALIPMPNGENISPEEIEGKVSELHQITGALLYYKDVVNIAERGFVLEITMIKDMDANMSEQVLKKVKAIVGQYEERYGAIRIVVRDTDFERTAAMKIKRP